MFLKWRERTVPARATSTTTKRQLHSAALSREVEMSQGESRGDRGELHSGLEFVSSDDRLFKVLPVPEAYGNEPSWSWEQEN